MRAIGTQPLSLRRTLVVITIFLGVIGTAAALALVTTTTALHRTAATISEAVESVRAAQDLEIQLLLHGRATTVQDRRSAEQALRGLVRSMESYAGDPREQQLLREVGRTIEHYLAGADTHSRSPEQAIMAIDRLVEMNVGQARLLRLRAERWDARANRVGWFSAGLLVVGIGLVILWLQRSALRPVVELQQTIERFERGETDARAPLRGPSELREIARRFNSMADALDGRRRTQMAFLASVAHDIRNPLAAMSLSVGALDRSEADPLPASRRRSVAMMKRQIDRLQRLAGDLIDAAQFEAGAMDIRKEPCDLGQLARDTCEIFAGLSDKHQLQCHLPDEPLIVHGDPVRLGQVLTNLVSNGIKYSTGGQVTVALQREERAAVIRVSDEGVGILPEEQPLIFDPFRRAASARKSPGAGLGLFISRQIVRAHGGTISLTSQPSQGSSFTVRIPCEHDATSVQPTADRPLAVDAEPRERRMMPIN